MSADHVIVGSDDWLFLGEGSNRSISQMTGHVSATPQIRNMWTRTLEVREKMFGERVLTIICPEKSAAYPQFLPEQFKLSENRFARNLERLGPNVVYAMPPDELSDRYYLKTDTHWTDLGSYDAAGMICDRLGIDSLDVATAWEARLQKGDLGSVMTPAHESTNWVLANAPEVRIVDNGLRNRGRVVRYSRREKRAHVLVFGDSFSGISLAKHLAYRTGDVTFVHSLSFDLELTQRLRPDYIVGQVAERFLIEPVTDGRSIGSVIIEKCHQGMFSDGMLERFEESADELGVVYGPLLQLLLSTVRARRRSHKALVQS